MQLQRRRTSLDETFKAMDADILLLQEHDYNYNIDGYTLYNVYVDTYTLYTLYNRLEGCSIGIHNDRKDMKYVNVLSSIGLDIGSGKSAMLLHLEYRDTLVSEYKKYLFVSVHLKGGPNTQNDKIAQMKYISQFICNIKYDYLILGGDFNDTDPTSTLYSALTVPLKLDHIYTDIDIDIERDKYISVTCPYMLSNPFIECITGSDHIPVLLSITRSFV